MIIKYLTILTFLGAYTIAIPIALNRATDAAGPSQSGPPMTSTGNTTRTLFNITWNCVSTIFICAWVSVHPNVPPSGQWRALQRRLKAMFWTIIAPELTLAWAVRQWFAAREIRDTVNGTKEVFLTRLKRTITSLFRTRSPPASARWTMEHGHLLAMGGISTVDPSFESTAETDPCGLVLTIEQYNELTEVEDGNLLKLKLQKISKNAINDRSKGDFLSKFIAILQTSWFILQCIARDQQRLAITELELVTLALASLNAITYAFWWYKPLDVQEPIRIYFTATKFKTMNRARTENSAPTSDISMSYIISGVGNFFLKAIKDFRQICQYPWKGPLSSAFPFDFILSIFAAFFILYVLLLVCLLLPFPLGIVLLLKILKTQPIAEQPPSNTRGLLAARIIFILQKLRYRLTSYVADISEMWLKKLFSYDNGRISFSAFYIGWLFLIPTLFFFLLATTILLLPLFTLLFLMSFIFTAVFGIITSSTVTPGATHVPSFYSPSTKSDKYSRMVVFALFGVIFGGLHCIGWNFTFPTPSEQHLWRVTSLAITAIPLTVAPIDYILENFELDNGFLRIVRLTLDFIMTVLLFIYVPARLSLIAQALALLRHQPQAAFLIVDWTKYIPHVY